MRCRQVGALMVEAQAAFDKYAMPMCPSQLTSPNLHKVLAYEKLKAHTWGGKGVGSQGDGCAQLLCKTEDDVETVMRIVQEELGMSCMPLQIGASRSLNQAIIPAASFSQNLFPASKSLPPALFPVLDSDGLLKPAILILVEEALAADINRVIIIVSSQQHGEFEAIFHKQPSIRDYNRLPPRLQQYADKINAEGATEAVFRKYAEQRSDCGSFKQGGDLGLFNSGDMQKQFEDGTLAMLQRRPSIAC